MVSCNLTFGVELHTESYLDLYIALAVYWLYFWPVMVIHCFKVGSCCRFCICLAD